MTDGSMMMALIYGKYKLDMTNDRFDDLVDSVREKLLNQCGLAGVQTVRLETYLAAPPKGVCFISDHGDIIGLGMKNSYFDRFAIVLNGDNYELQLDTSDTNIVGIADIVLDMDGKQIRHKVDTSLSFNFKEYE